MPVETKVKWSCPSPINVKNFTKSINAVGILTIPNLCKAEINNKILRATFRGQSRINGINISFNISAPPDHHPMDITSNNETYENVLSLLTAGDKHSIDEAG